MKDIEVQIGTLDGISGKMVVVRMFMIIRCYLKLYMVMFVTALHLFIHSSIYLSIYYSSICISTYRSISSFSLCLDQLILRIDETVKEYSKQFDLLMTMLKEQVK